MMATDGNVNGFLYLECVEMEVKKLVAPIRWRDTEMWRHGNVVVFHRTNFIIAEVTKVAKLNWDR